MTLIGQRERFAHRLRSFIRAWSPWHLRRDLAVAQEDVRRFHVHLYCCNVQRDLAEARLSNWDVEQAREAWRREEATVIARAEAWNA